MFVSSFPQFQIQPDCLFKLLLALEKDCKDNLGVLDLVLGEKPLKALVRLLYIFLTGNYSCKQ